MSKTLAQAYLDASLQLPMEDIKVKQRLDRAYGILQDYGYDIVEAGTIDNVQVYEVSKASTSLLEDTSAFYIVTNKECTCPDYATARANLCKHRLAIMLLEDMQHG